MYLNSSLTCYNKTQSSVNLKKFNQVKLAFLHIIFPNGQRNCLFSAMMATFSNYSRYSIVTF